MAKVKRNICLTIQGLLLVLFVFIANIKNYNLSGLFPLLGYGPKTTFLLGLSNLFAFSSISILYLYEDYSNIKVVVL